MNWEEVKVVLVAMELDYIKPFPGKKIEKL